MALYDLSESQVSNLKTLLERVDIKGSEAIVFIDLLKALSTPINHAESDGAKAQSTSKKEGVVWQKS